MMIIKSQGVPRVNFRVTDQSAIYWIKPVFLSNPTLIISQKQIPTVILLMIPPQVAETAACPVNPKRIKATKLGQIIFVVHQPYMAPKKIPTTVMPNGVMGAGAGIKRKKIIIATEIALFRYHLLVVDIKIIPSLFVLNNSYPSLIILSIYSSYAINGVLTIL